MPSLLTSLVRALPLLAAITCIPAHAQGQVQGQPQGQPQTAAQAEPGFEDSIGQRMQACAACHGKEGRSSSEGYYPRIAGKAEGYLANQLANFREGRRVFPAMNHLVGQFSDAYIKEIAHYFASQELPYAAPQPSPADKQQLARGELLVKNGDSAKKLPACVACHGEKLTGTQPFIPGLVGMPRDYLIAQLGAWKIGQRKAHAPDCMAHITREMSIEDINAVSSWLATQVVPADSAPAKAPAVDLPLECGSMPGLSAKAAAQPAAGRAASAKAAADKIAARKTVNPASAKAKAINAVEARP